MSSPYQASAGAPIKSARPPPLLPADRQIRDRRESGAPDLLNPGQLLAEAAVRYAIGV